MIEGITLKPLTVGLRDELDAYYQEHETVPDRAWVLCRVLVNQAGERAYTPDQIREMPLADVVDYWDAFQESINPNQ